MCKSLFTATHLRSRVSISLSPRSMSTLFGYVQASTLTYIVSLLIPSSVVMTKLPCHCGKQIQYFKCSQLAPGSIKADLSCTKTCGKKLGCENHPSEDVCHPGDCQPCAVKDTIRCYCGKAEQDVSCGEGEPKECIVDGDDGVMEKWTGRFQCDNNCDQ